MKNITDCMPKKSVYLKQEYFIFYNTNIKKVFEYLTYMKVPTHVIFRVNSFYYFKIDNYIFQFHLESLPVLLVSDL